MRPRTELVATTSFTATCLPSPSSSCKVGSSTTAYSPAKTRGRPDSIASGSTEARKPTRPKLTPITGTSLPRSAVSARRIVPSPPIATTRSALRGSSAIATPASAAARSTRSTAALTSLLPCVRIAAVLTGRDRCVDPLVEVIGKRRVVRLRHVEEELPVALRTREPGVYDAEDARPPLERACGDFVQDAGPDRRVADDTALADVGAARLELRLDEHDGLPARRCEPKERRQRDADRDERHVADDELRRK